jgi:hypothetical protein
LLLQQAAAAAVDILWELEHPVDQVAELDP